MSFPGHGAASGASLLHLSPEWWTVRWNLSDGNDLLPVERHEGVELLHSLKEQRDGQQQQMVKIMKLISTPEDWCSNNKYYSEHSPGGDFISAKNIAIHSRLPSSFSSSPHYPVFHVWWTDLFSPNTFPLTNLQLALSKFSHFGHAPFLEETRLACYLIRGHHSGGLQREDIFIFLVTPNLELNLLLNWT